VPHIVIESTPRLSAAIDFVALFSAVHHRLAADGCRGMYMIPRQRDPFFAAAAAGIISR